MNRCILYAVDYTVYLNGERVGSATLPRKMRPTEMAGAFEIVLPGSGCAAMDEFTVFDIRLTPEQIRARFQARQ